MLYRLESTFTLINGTVSEVPSSIASRRLFLYRGIMTIRRTILIAALVCSPAAAQSVPGSGAIGGLVRDNYGDGLPDTKVTIYNKALGVDRTVATTDDGVFQAPGLVPGQNYLLKISRSGFADWESKAFEVPVGQTRAEPVAS
jgi:hypothetical protein